MNEFIDAYNEYVGRKNRDIRPSVNWIKDESGFFIDFVLAQDEHFKCCDRFTDKDPKKIMGHLRSIEHIANMYALDYKKFRKYVTSRRIAETKKRRRNMANTWKPNF